MITWGIVANSHDASLAVSKTVTKGLTTKTKENILWAGLAKDFSGVPNDPHLNEDIIQHVWNTYGAPDRVVWYERPLLKTFRQIRAGQGFRYFKENNVGYLFQKYKHPLYKQIHPGNFLPNLSFLDILFNCGKIDATNIFKESKKIKNI